MTIYDVSGKVEPYPDDDLPEGFVYPPQFRKMLGKVDNFAFYPWVFIKPTSEGYANTLRLTRDEVSGFVPFAVEALSEGKHVGFDGYDASGNPKVIMVFFDGSNTPQEKGDFSDWLERAKSDSIQWAKDKERLARQQAGK